MPEPLIRCAACGQDYLRPYRSLLDGQEFLLCPECDSVWLPGEDTTQWPPRYLDNLFADHQFVPGQGEWDFIEPVEPGDR
jgi:DNA-directed RNA polymerase subunit RPC12/RpoP